MTSVYCDVTHVINSINTSMKTFQLSISLELPPYVIVSEPLGSGSYLSCYIGTHLPNEISI